ncbi:hypothetical protein [Neolewinella antarctica]|uniref:DUF2306 domain-containing protein n=1 Tax=Neolewinella antarctica TaxID=442734 RepID=A0ABX0XA20_9BACT|nr:hypothetical protein [Neolewinella antarctica]NJC25668.1 hypothetical protein [Neolewinella antarctica]
METLERLLLTVHIFAGFSSIVLFFVPAIARKGGLAHARYGWYYVYCMWTVVITAGLLSVFNYLDGQIGAALFLGYLALLTGRQLYYGIAVLRHKKGPSPGMLRTDLALRLGLAAGGVFLIGAFFNWWGPAADPLFLIFGILGSLISLPSLVGDLRGRKVVYNWLVTHLTKMVSTYIAATTAFLAFGGQRFIGDFFPGNWAILLWTAPTVLGLAFVRYYKWRMSKTTRMS